MMLRFTARSGDGPGEIPCRGPTIAIAAVDIEEVRPGRAHDPNDYRQGADAVLVLHSGRVVTLGDTFDDVCMRVGAAKGILSTLGVCGCACRERA